MAARPAGHAAFDHPHLVAAAGGAGFAAGGCVDGDDFGVGVGFQAHALAFDEADRDQMAFDHAADLQRGGHGSAQQPG